MKGAIEKAILLVGGKGTRLAPFTNSTPKPMIRIAGAPVTEHQILKARAAGVKEIVLATSYLAEVFQPYFGNGEKFGVSIKYAVEQEPLGTGGAIANAAKALSLKPNESLFIFNGDVLSEHNLAAQSQFHQELGADATLHLIEVVDASSYGCVPIDRDGRVLDFLEKMPQPKAKTINAGCYIFKSEIIEKLPHGEVISIERDAFPKWLSDDCKIYGYLDSSYWIDMGTPETMVRASRDLVRRNHGAALILPSATIHPSAVIDGGSFIEADSLINSDVRISGSIIAAGAIIESGAIIENSYIASQSRVKKGSNLREIIQGF